MLNLIKYPNHPLLQQCAAWDFNLMAEPVTGLALEDIISRMFEIMYASHGVGLAANQIGLCWRIFVADRFASTQRQGQERLVAINPELSELEGLQVGREGCLSLDPRVQFPVKRSATCRLKAYDPAGNVFEGDAEGFEARIFQHEVDHLAGRCCIDLTDRYSREIAMKKWKKLKGRR